MPDLSALPSAFALAWKSRILELQTTKSGLLWQAQVTVGETIKSRKDQAGCPFNLNVSSQIICECELAICEWRKFVMMRMHLGSATPRESYASFASIYSRKYNSLA